MKKPLLFISILICAIGAVTACSMSLHKETGEITSVTESTTDLSSGSTRSTVPESDPTKASTRTETANPFTFDLTEEEVTQTGAPLMLIKGEDEAVIIGGQTSPSTKKGSFYSGFGSMDWDETAYNNDSENCKYSMDRSKLVFSPRGEEGNNSLVYYDGTKAQVITSEFSDYVFSLSGNAVAYSTPIDGLHTIDELYIYDCEKKVSRRICKNFVCYRGDFCISPSGDAVLYADSRDPLNIIIGYNEPVMISSTGNPIAISDGGEFVYYEKTNGLTWELYVYKEGRSIKLLSARMNENQQYVNRSYIFNRDRTQILIALETRLWFSMDGSQAVCVADTNDVGTPLSSEYRTEYDFTCRSTEPLIRDGHTIYLPAKNLCNQLYRFAGTLLYLDSNLNERYFAAQVPEHAHESSVYGDHLVYMEKSPNYSGDDLYYTNNFREAGTADKVPVEYAADAVLTENGSIYVENDIGQLFVVNGDDAPRLIATYADLIGRYEVDGTTYVFFTQDPGSRAENYDWVDLYRVEDVSGAEPQKVASGIYGAHIDVTGIYIHEPSTRTGAGYDWYEDIRYSEDGNRFVFLCTKIFGP